MADEQTDKTFRLYNDGELARVGGLDCTKTLPSSFDVRDAKNGSVLRTEYNGKVQWFVYYEGDWEVATLDAIEVVLPEDKHLSKIYKQCCAQFNPNWETLHLAARTSAMNGTPIAVDDIKFCPWCGVEMSKREVIRP